MHATSEHMTRKPGGSDRGTQRKADGIAHDLLTRIVRGELKPGSLLPKESELAERYGVNRSVVREANKLLEVHRLVRPIRRRGTEVLDPNQSLTPEVVRATLIGRDGHIDRAAFADFLEVRQVLDVQLSCLAAENRSDDDLRRLEQLVSEIRAVAAVGGPAERYGELSTQLSIEVARASGNRLLVMMAHWNRQISLDLEPLFRSVRPATDWHLRGVEALVDAIRRRNPELVRDLLEAYHRWATPHLLEALDEANRFAPPAERSTADAAVSAEGTDR